MNRRKPATWRVAVAVGKVTFLEVIRDKILYNIIFCAALLFGLSFLASRLTFIRPERVILDFGLSATSLSCAMIAVFTGSGLLGRERDRRTLTVALSHPISMSQFVLGKYTGLVGVITVNWALLSTAYLGLLALAGGGEAGAFNSTLAAALLLALLQSMIVAAAAIFFSSFSTTSLSAVMTIGLYLVGNSISEIIAVAARIKSPAGSKAVSALAAMLPNLEHFNIGKQVTYGLPITGQFLHTSVVYCLVVSALLVVLAGLCSRSP